MTANLKQVERLTAAEIASDMEDDIATIRDLGLAVLMIGQSKGFIDGRAIERLGYMIRDHAEALEGQRRRAAGQTGE